MHVARCALHVSAQYFHRPPLARRDHRHAARHRLEDHAAERLGTERVMEHEVEFGIRRLDLRLARENVDPGEMGKGKRER